MVPQNQVFDYKNSDFVREAGMVINPSALTIDGRRLRVPRILYGNGSEVRHLHVPLCSPTRLYITHVYRQSRPRKGLGMWSASDS